MRIGNNGRRGMTLAELSIVLAVIAIVSTLVVTFVVLVNERSNASTARLDALNEVALAESMIESWIEENHDAVLAENTENNNLVVEDSTYSLLFTPGNAENDGKSTLTIDGVDQYFSKIVNVKFTVKAPQVGDTADKLFICTVTYEAFEGEGGTHIFVVDPHVGEGVTINE